MSVPGSGVNDGGVVCSWCCYDNGLFFGVEPKDDQLALKAERTAAADRLWEQFGVVTQTINQFTINCLLLVYSFKIISNILLLTSVQTAF